MSRKCNIDPNCPGPEFKGCPDSPEHDPALLFTPAMGAMADLMDALNRAVCNADRLEEVTGESMDDVLETLHEVTEMIKRKCIPLN